MRDESSQAINHWDTMTNMAALLGALGLAVALTAAVFAPTHWKTQAGIAYLQIGAVGLAVVYGLVVLLQVLEDDPDAC